LQLCAVLSLALLAGPAVHADVLVGGMSGNDTTAANPVIRFGDNGNAPLSTFYTDFTGERLQTPFALAYEPTENVVYVSDFYGQAVRVYAADASGNLTSLRYFKSPLLGQPRRVAISAAHDELLTIASLCCVAAYARTASGNSVAASRFIQWGGLSGSVTRLDNPADLALRSSSDELIVAEYGPAGGVLLFFDRTASGNAAPTRTIEGAQTLLGLGVIGVSYDAAHDEIIALVAADATTAASRIVTFSGSATGNAAPLRAIEGASTLLVAGSSIDYDAAHGLIYVSEGGYNGYPARVLAFPRAANGDTTPARSICSALLPQNPIGIAAVPPGPTIFRDNFEPTGC
jgi:hypothetical protein